MATRTPIDEPKMVEIIHKGQEINYWLMYYKSHFPSIPKSSYLPRAYPPHIRPKSHLVLVPGKND